jgi:hypothetical protein
VRILRILLLETWASEGQIIQQQGQQYQPRAKANGVTWGWCMEVLDGVHLSIVSYTFLPRTKKLSLLVSPKSIFFAIFGFEFRALCLLGRCFSQSPVPPFFFYFSYHLDKVSHRKMILLYTPPT